jgi:glycosyltransferase involved in cell wall biosynthesis
MKITILWSHLASYSVAFFESLSMQNNCEIQLVYISSVSNSPYHKFDLSFCKSIVEQDLNDEKLLTDNVLSFSPDVILMASWNYKIYMSICRKFRKRGGYVISATDNQWLATSKQYLGILTSNIFLKPSIDTFIVPGERQATFIRKLGFNDILQGWYAAKVKDFINDSEILYRENAFLFVGRLVPQKGIHLLVNAYNKYCSSVDKPWKLIVAGVGPLQELIESHPNIDYIGFVQPKDLPRLMWRAKCFILPSYFEPWGVVIQEAAVAGLPILSSYKCGAVTAYLRNGLNGYLMSPKVESILNTMLKISAMTEEDILTMSKYSSLLGKLWTPEMQARYFINSIREKVYHY